MPSADNIYPHPLFIPLPYTLKQILRYIIYPQYIFDLPLFTNNWRDNADGAILSFNGSLRNA
jgi:hypothetical protein